MTGVVRARYALEFKQEAVRLVFCFVASKQLIADTRQPWRCTRIAAPRQRNTQDEKKAIKDGRIPDA